MSLQLNSDIYFIFQNVYNNSGQETSRKIGIITPGSTVRRLPTALCSLDAGLAQVLLLTLT